MQLNKYLSINTKEIQGYQNLVAAYLILVILPNHWFKLFDLLINYAELGIDIKQIEVYL